MPFAHLVFLPVNEINMLSRAFNAPEFLKYGHLFAVLQSGDQITRLDIDWQNTHVRFMDTDDLEKWFIRDVFGLSTVMRFVEDGKISDSDLDMHIDCASFQIDDETYERARDQYLDLAGSFVPYFRLGKNCIYYALEHMRLAGIDLGDGRGYTAGRFFDKVKKESLGDLLTPQFKPQVEVVERVVSVSSDGTVVREKIDIEAMSRDL